MVCQRRKLEEQRAVHHGIVLKAQTRVEIPGELSVNTLIVTDCPLAQRIETREEGKYQQDQVQNTLPTA